MAEFATGLAATLRGVLERPESELELELNVTANEGEHGSRFVVETPGLGIPLQVDRMVVLRLELDYALTLDSRDEWLKVESSTFAVRPEGNGEPFFRYDYQSQPRSIPSAHINIHAHRDDLIAALIGGRSSTRARRRRTRFIDDGQLPRFSKFHFPVGGRRFRPCLEDLLESVIDEFGIDCADGYREVLQRGRRSYRESQMKATVRSSPGIAVEVLRSMGYRVTEPAQTADASSPASWLTEH